ncbi:PREDICTED: putative F-box/kelch-repeat protein At5g03000 [Camelina sativa]|uniref:F-box/kelch-repeat protein At5g03000 n=1 Tax=Camelina sativa TaxID=90675 RepID=A0ABM0TBM6_CAMSA|nr:PREDICTED: putative F-box/kelch-repeat protein At5g03000 [Camelina sativa]
MFCSCLEIILFLTGLKHSQPDEKEITKSSDSPPEVFSSLPADVILNCLARVPRFYGPTLSLVSRDFKSLIASPELEATRSCIGVTENYLCVCLELNKNNSDTRWFTLSPLPKQHKLKPIPSFPYQHPKSSTVLSIGSEIYIIGGFVKGRRSRRVLVLDCRSHQWRRLPNMRQPTVSAAAEVIDGKMYVIGGCRYNDIDKWGEVYDPKTQTWEPVLPTTQDLTIQKSVVPGRLVMGGKVYTMCYLSYKLALEKGVCLVEVEKVLCLISVSEGKLRWFDPEEDLGVTVWWRSVVFGRLGLGWTKECKTEIWCAEISFERRGFGSEIWGFVEWSKIVFTFEGCDSPSDFFLHSTNVTY